MTLVGSIAPNFTAFSTKGEIRLSSLRGKNVLLIFYPMNNTPGWTKQLSAARDAAKEYDDLDTVVLGINPASVEKHQQYCGTNQFNFPLVEDTNNRIRKSFHVTSILGLIQKRTVILIDKHGIIRWVQRGMPLTETILEKIKALE